MNTSMPKPEELSVLVGLSPQTVLIDRRISTRGIVFGTIENVAKQYGIKMTMTDQGLKLTGPKSRLQMFVEKLHFARAPYTAL